MFTSTPRIKRLQSIIEADGFNQSAHFLLGQEYLTEGKFMAAAAKFRRVVELNPDHVEAWRMMARAYEKAGVTKESEAARLTAEGFREMVPEAGT